MMAAGVAHVMTGVAFATVKLWATGVAAVYLVSPAWLAVTVTRPAPVIVRMEPETIAGPVTM